MDKIEGLALLKTIIDKQIHHEDYKRVVELAEKYYKMKTGDGIETLLQQIETRTTQEEFDQIKRIYRSIIPSTLNSTKMPFQKATRKQPIKEINFETESEDKEIELQGYISTYWGDKSLEKYMEYAFVDYNYIDPNAFLITEFGDFDPRTEKAAPYPFIADCKQAVMFEYKNELLEYLVVKLPVKYNDKGVERTGDKYTMYLGMDTIVLSQVGASEIELDKKYFEYFEYEPKNEKVPAMRFGYLRDEVTKGRTFVSVFHAVIGYLEKTLKIDSELDLSTAMVAFPQRFAYVSPCKNTGCNKGYMPDSSICPVCQGTGQEPFHKGTQDVITLALPRNATNADMINLENMLVYKSPPIELLNFQREYIDSLKKSVHAMMFNADLYTRDQVSVTATEALQEHDNLNDTLYPFGQHYSAMWEYVVMDIATFTDLSEGLSVHHQFPKDFKFKSIEQLMTELKMSKDANASTSTISAIEDDINEILYSDRPDELKEMRIKNDINPFRGYSETNIRFIISSGETTRYNIVLWNNLEAIFEELEQENEEFYYLPEITIIEKVKVKTNEYIVLIDAEKQKEAEKYMALNPQQ